MVPRNEIVGLNLDNKKDGILDTIINCGYTRIPIFRGDINQIEGILHMKNVPRLLRMGGEGLTQRAIKRFAREPYFVPKNTPLNKQLLNFKLNQRRIAVVVDEYGEIEGLVTLEDILEEIVGDFTTNKAEEENPGMAIIKNDFFEIDGSQTIREINKEASWDLPTDGPKTLSGLVLEYLENIPDGNVSLTIENYRIETISLSDKSVTKLQVKQLMKKIEQEEEDDI
jgi:Mg2+/Co2+ transporter CorB